MVSTRITAFLSFLVNLFLAFAKFLAWGLTGNASMLSQVCHSISDSWYQLLVLAGVRLGDPRETTTRGFGRTKERYFFVFVVTMLLFGIAGYISFRQGYNQLGAPYREVNVTINYVVLAGAILFQIVELARNYRGLRRTGTENGLSLLSRSPRASETPFVNATLQNVTSILGVAVAFVGVYLSDVTGSPFYDAVASMVIGGLLLSFAGVLTWKKRTLIAGGGLNGRERETITDVIGRTDVIPDVVDLRAMQVGPDQVHVAVEVAIAGDFDVSAIQDALDRVNGSIREQVPQVQVVKIESDDGTVLATASP